jgi:hypothetical protein
VFIFIIVMLLPFWMGFGNCELPCLRMQLPYSSSRAWDEAALVVGVVGPPEATPGELVPQAAVTTATATAATRVRTPTRSDKRRARRG